jgi:hypothetical protein
MKTMIDLTERFPMRFDVERMTSELRVLEKSQWVDHYDRTVSTGWTAIPLVSRDGTMNDADSQRVGKFGSCKRTPILDELPYFREIVDAFQCPLGRVRISRLMPGTIIRAHRDVGEEAASFACNQVRLHIPIITNNKVTFIVGGEQLRLLTGRLYYVNFSKKHAVRNDGTEARVHLILDLQVNDFLRFVFPPLSLIERAECVALRHALPFVWRLQAIKPAVERWFWANYEGSRLQRLRHAVRGRREQQVS